MEQTTRTRDDRDGPVAGAPPEGGGVLAGPYRALTFGIVSVVLMIAFEATAVSTAMPVAARDLHGLGLYGFAFSGYFTTSLLAMVVSGQWCDRDGPLPPLAAGIAGFAAGLVVSGTAGSMGLFVLGRAVQGLGGGLVIVALYVVVGRAYPERLRPAVMAAFSASWVVPSIVGPLVSGAVTEQLGWRWVFLAIPVLVVLPLAVMLPPLRRTTRASKDAAAEEGGASEDAAGVEGGGDAEDAAGVEGGGDAEDAAGVEGGGDAEDAAGAEGGGGAEDAAGVEGGGGLGESLQAEIAEIAGIAGIPGGAGERGPWGGGGRAGVSGGAGRLAGSVMPGIPGGAGERGPSGGSAGERGPSGAAGNAGTAGERGPSGGEGRAGERGGLRMPAGPRRRRPLPGAPGGTRLPLTGPGGPTVGSGAAGSAGGAGEWGPSGGGGRAGVSGGAGRLAGSGAAGNAGTAGERGPSGGEGRAGQRGGLQMSAGPAGLRAAGSAGGSGDRPRLLGGARGTGRGRSTGRGRDRALTRGPALDGRRIWLAAALATGAALLQYAGQDLRPRSALPAVLGAALLVPAALRLLPRGTFRAARGLPTVILMRGIAAGSFIAAESFVPLMLVTQRGLSPTLAGLSLAGGGLTWALGSYVQARPRLEPFRERLVQFGMLLSTAAIAAVPLALIHSVPPWIVAVAWCAGGLGMGLAISALSVLLLRLSPPAEAGTNAAALQVADALSNVLMVGAVGTVFTALGGGSLSSTGAAAGHPAAFTAVFLPAAGVALTGVAVATRLRARPVRT